MSALFLLICLLVLVSVWASLVTYSFFWCENAWRARLAADPGSKLKSMVLAGLLSSIASVLFIIVSHPLGMIRRLWLPGDISDGRPIIILTHGLYHNASAWLLLRTRLRKAGFKNIFVMSYGSFFTSFEKTLKKFEDFVADARHAVPNQPVYLIGHSLGGLLSRVYAERSKGPAIPAAVITLGCPHQGSKIAAFGLGRLASSLIYRGPLFAEIEAGPARLPCNGVAIFSPVDNMVLPSEAMRVPYPGWVYFETDPLSHTAMLYSKSTAKKVVEVLREEMDQRRSWRGKEGEMRRTAGTG
ncbi:MAG: alpha/beta fold hydrolase [Syntrophobacteraceae bacterium]|jgi:triacylglycerol esterase/lipase EstA (alpha/beta hydrolase family)